VAVATAAVLVTLAVVPWTPAGLPVLLAALVAVPGAVLWRHRGAS
jgi:hypothetical protein